jgi:hypothetical protein
MNDKKAWRTGAAKIIGGELDGLMILAGLERIEEKLDGLKETLSSKKRRRAGTFDPCGPTGARI